MTYASDQDAVNAVQEYLGAQIAAGYADTFAEWGGVKVLTQDEEREGKGGCRPRAVFALERGTVSRLFRLPQARDCEVSVQIKANEFEGGRPRVGPGGEAPAQTLGSDTLLSQAMAQVLDEASDTTREAMRELGLYRVEVRPQREVTRTESGAAQVQVDPHRITFTYFRPA